MADTSALVLVGAVAVVGVLHTVVPDHWVPITLIARQRGWSKAETARVAFKAGTGHVLSTLAIAVVIWVAGVAVATRFGQWVDTIASLALVGFGAWIAISAWRDLHGHGGQSQSHHRGHSDENSNLQNVAAVHGNERQRIDTRHGLVELSIFEAGAPPRFRLTGNFGPSAMLETRRDNGTVETFFFKDRGGYWESDNEIAEPHQFEATLTIVDDNQAHTFSLQFAEHRHGHERNRPDHLHQESIGSRTALLLILGSSPMVEGIPAFFAAAKYGVGIIVLMSLVFGAATITTYVVLCVYSTAGLQRVSIGPLERYGEVLSGGCIALVGLAFWIWPGF
jgi:hypothetical protein